MLPEFLVIGAMKAGTTTLYHDLRMHTDAFIPDKELGALTDDAVLTSSGRAAYAARYARIRPGQRAGDVSTTYSMLPDIIDCAARAHQVLGAETKIVYLLRNPIDRIVSQHHHERQDGRTTLGIDDAVREHERYVAFSQYARQLDPWLERFGSDQVMVVTLEDYRSARTAVIRRICDFIGASFVGEEIDATTVYNESRAKPVVRARWQTLHGSRLYRRAIRPLMSAELRTRVRSIVLPRSALVRDTPSAATTALLVERLRDDLDRQRRILGDIVAPYQPDELLHRQAGVRS